MKSDKSHLTSAVPTKTLPPALSKSALEAQILALRKKLGKITDAETAQENAALLGKCYRTRNNYSVPETAADYWWLYARVVSVAGGLKVTTFQDDKKGRLSVEQKSFYVGQSLRGYEEISEAAFMKAWAKFTDAVAASKITPDKP